jgi:hypothetical protein
VLLVVFETKTFAGWFEFVDMVVFLELGKPYATKATPKTATTTNKTGIDFLIILSPRSQLKW